MTVKDIQSVTIEVSTSALKVDKVQIEFLETLPHWRPRVENVVYGIKMRFTDKDLISVKQKHDVDPLSRRLPKETFSFTIHDYDMRYDPDNPRGIYAYIDTRSPISIQYGYDLDDGTVEGSRQTIMFWMVSPRRRTTKRSSLELVLLQA